QNYVGVANDQRFPTFLSVDIKLSKDFSLPLTSWLKNHKFRGAVHIYNITNHYNPLDVFSNVTSPNFGHFVGLQHRLFDASIDIVY
ncbi:MAG TPA: hypothetical protein VGV68_09235, partial [Terriglobia bacterium]|nr:hypothetical protein [Terriglobia bacterium]